LRLRARVREAASPQIGQIPFGPDKASLLFRLAHRKTAL
jgi:hypothetical protein